MKKKKKTSCFESQRAVLRKSRFDRKYSCCCCVAIRGCRINPFLFGLFYYYSQTLKDLLLPKIIAFNPFLCRVLRVPVPPMLLPPMYWWYKNKPSFCPYHMLIFRIFDALKEYKKLRYSWLRNHFNPFFLFITIRSCQLKNLLLPRGMAVSNYEKRIQVWDQRNQFQCQLFYKMLQKLIRR